MRLLAVERIGLEPLLALGDEIGARRGDYAVSSRHQVGHSGLARHRGESDAVGFVARAGHDHARDSGGGLGISLLRDRAGIQVCLRVNHAVQAVGERLVEHVVGHLAGRIARAARVVKQDDVEVAQARFVGRKAVDAAAERAATGVVLPVKRPVVLEHEYRQVGGRERRGLHQHRDGPPGGRAGRRRAGRKRNRRAAHAVAGARVSGLKRHRAVAWEY